ncbi:MAG: hypothetical protein ROR55_01370 [Devosia sp.]
MRIKQNAIALGTAFAIGLGALAPTGAAQAAPLAPAAVAHVEIDNAGVEKVHRRGRRHKHHFHGFNVYVGPGYYGRRCFKKRVRVWSPKLHAYVIKRRKVCRRHW